MLGKERILEWESVENLSPDKDIKVNIYVERLMESETVISDVGPKVRNYFMDGKPSASRRITQISSGRARKTHSHRHFSAQ